MKITGLETTPIFLPTIKPYRWSLGVKSGGVLVLVTVTTDEGIVGFGECIGSPSAEALCDYFEKAKPFCLGQSPFDVNRITTTVYDSLLRLLGPSSAPRFGAQLLAGLDMALWDVVGKAMGRPLHQLIGGATRNAIPHFGFAQGETPEELAAHAAKLVAAGSKVIYVKIGRSETLDLAIVKAVRDAIGSARLRLDANEAWDVLTTIRMSRALEAFDPEMIEQPTSSENLSALRQARKGMAIPIAADQLVFTPADAYEVCRTRSADLIVIGLHEAGTVTRLLQVAAITQAAGLNVCIHGKMESGITTCASAQVAAAISNLDDGNQYMNALLAEDIVASPDLQLHNGTLAVPTGPGLGFELDMDAVENAAERYRAHESNRS